MESGGRKNQDRSINEQREHERRARIDGGKLDSFAPAFRRLLEFPRLHDGRVQIKIVRHHGGAKDTDADVKHFLICDTCGPGINPSATPTMLGLEKISSSAKHVRWSRLA